jgi:hypothetical protein
MNSLKINVKYMNSWQVLFSVSMSSTKTQLFYIHVACRCNSLASKAKSMRKVLIYHITARFNDKAAFTSVINPLRELNICSNPLKINLRSHIRQH